VETEIVGGPELGVATVRDYLRAIRAGEVEIPQFARPLRWRGEMYSRYVEGVVRGMGLLTTIVLARVPGRPWVIVDGVHRTLALLAAEEGRVEVFGRPLREQPGVMERFYGAQLALARVEVADASDALRLFMALSANARQPRHLDLFLAMRAVDARATAVYSLGERLEALRAARDPYAYAARAVYAYLTLRVGDRRPRYDAILMFGEDEVGEAAAEIERACARSRLRAEECGAAARGLDYGRLRALAEAPRNGSAAGVPPEAVAAYMLHASVAARAPEGRVLVVPSSTRRALRRLYPGTSANKVLERVMGAASCAPRDSAYECDARALRRACVEILRAALGAPS
jgi:hypothetical protein